METKKYPIRNINLVILLVYMLVIHGVVGAENDTKLKFFMAMFLPIYIIGFHTLLLLTAFVVFSFIKKNEWARQCLLSAGLVLVIGFSTCLGGLFLYGD